MADEQIRIDVTARDDASDTLEDVADEAEKLEKLTPEVEVTADTSRAESDVKALGEDVDTLSRKDTEILLRAKIDDARGQLKSLRADLEQTGDKARDTDRELGKLGGEGGMRTRGQAIADLTGPLGEASGAASDFAGVFDGIGDIAGDVAGKVGLNAGAMTAAISGIGVAVARAAALWTVFRQNQDKAKERQRELVAGQREINDAIREGNLEAGASKFQELYGADVLNAAKLFGKSVEEVTDYVTGNNDALAANIEMMAAQGPASRVATDTLTRLRDEYVKANGTIAEQDAVVEAVRRSFERNNTAVDASTRAQERAERQADRTRDAFDRIRGSLNMESALLRFNEQMATAMTNAQSGAGNTAEDILDIKSSILDVAEYAKLTPVEVRSLLEAVDRGDLDWVRGQVEGYYANAPVSIHTRLLPPTQAAINGFVGAVQSAVGTITVPGRVAFAGVSGAVYSGPRG